MLQIQRVQQKILVFLFLSVFCAGSSRAALAATASAEALREQIQNRTENIQLLQRQIDAYQADINKVQGEAKTLKNTVRSLDLSVKKFDTDIRLTQNKIQGTNAEIDDLSNKIDEKRASIEAQTAALSGALRAMQKTDAYSLLEITLSHANFSDFFDEIKNLSSLERALGDDVKSLQDLKNQLMDTRVASEEKKQELQKYTNQLADKKSIVEYTKREKSNLLAVTKNKEANYKVELAKAQSRKEVFERELNALESQLRLEIDPKSIPGAQKGILSWPVKDPTITQYFGNTDFARANAQLYRGSGHNGVDFRAQPGTPVYAALSGSIAGTGNTDAVPGCYSYGKWVLVRHPNGLSTLYAHLSIIKVDTGQPVGVGDIIGLSGKTGYATGPHLHFTVYATQGVRIQKFDGSVGCKATSIPIADLRAYLNPLSYLPAL